MAEVFSATELAQKLQNTIASLQQARAKCLRVNMVERQMKKGMSSEQDIADTCQAILTDAAADIDTAEGILGALNMVYQYRIFPRPQTGFTSVDVDADDIGVAKISANVLQNGDDPFGPVATGDLVEIRDPTSSANYRVKHPITTALDASLESTTVLSEDTTADTRLTIVLRERA